MSTPEGTVKAAVKKWLRTRAWFWYMPVQNGMGVVGIPDFVCCRPVVVTPDMVGKTIGVFVGIETKAPGKERALTENQKRIGEEIQAAGGSWFVCSDVSPLDAWN